MIDNNTHTDTNTETAEARQARLDIEAAEIYELAILRARERRAAAGRAVDLAPAIKEAETLERRARLIRLSIARIQKLKNEDAA
jgi:hypothetical protein